MQEKVFIIDRVEGNSVVLEDCYGELITIDKRLIEGETKEGNVLINKDGLFTVDIEATIGRRNKINALMKGMWEE